jgi:Fic family protein
VAAGQDGPVGGAVPAEQDGPVGGAVPAGHARYAGEVTDPTRDSSAPPESVYTPFPSFQEWMASFDVDTALFDGFAARLTSAKGSSTPESMTRAIEIATKWAAIDTGAIEGLYDVDRGFTFSVAAQAAAWDNIHLAKDDYTERAIKDALEAYEFVLDAATQTVPVTEVLIKQVHEIICASQDEFTVITAVGPQKQAMPKGTYKQHPNSPFNIASGSVHGYASVLDTPPEMGRLVAELTSAEFTAAHPVAQAAYAHYAFVCVHPFADGNGRVSRALASIYLYRSPGVPLVIFADQKNGYIDALEAADAGRYGAFSQFVFDRTVDTLQLVADEARTAEAGPLSARIDQLNASLLGAGGLPHDEVDALAGLLMKEFQAALVGVRGAAGLQSPLSSTVSSNYGHRGSPTDGYRDVTSAQFIAVHVESAAPATAAADVSYFAGVARPSTRGAELIIRRTDASVVVEAFFRDVTPLVTSALRHRLELAAEREFTETVSRTVARAEDELRSKGYLE